MKRLKAITPSVYLVLLATFCFIGCTKNDSKFYRDGEEDGLAIFSNTENNVMSCYINGEAWHTNPRITTYFLNTSTSYEVTLHRTSVTNTLETVQISWQGYYQNDKLKIGEIDLQLLIPRNSFQRYFNALQGKRMAIDSSAGNYFIASAGPAFLSGRKVNGNIYFHTMHIDSIAPGWYTGKMSGIFEANSSVGAVTKGRFDHELTQYQIQ